MDISTIRADDSLISEYYHFGIFENVGFQSIRRIAVIDDSSRKNINDLLEATARNPGVQVRFYYNNGKEVADWLKLPK